MSAMPNIDQEAIARFCRRYPIARLSLFGSILHGDFGSDSDVDMLVEFQPDAEIGYFTLAIMEQELTAIVGRQVDLRTPAELSRYFRDQVLAEAKVQFAA
ncbi:MAG: nucleotidyltransferase family protein [Phycisphaeraceae bacterium]|nr:nucleotidyltransferase family protein [Phycisphaeraceae bacterium]